MLFYSTPRFINSKLSTFTYSSPGEATIARTHLDHIVGSLSASTAFIKIHFTNNGVISTITLGKAISSS